MKLTEYLSEKLWNTAIFSRVCGVRLDILRKIVNEKGSVSLDTALQIEAATHGKVKAWDLSPKASDIMQEFEYSLEQRGKKQKKKDKKNGSKHNEKYKVDVDCAGFPINY
jgi:hypothetical protein